MRRSFACQPIPLSLSIWLVVEKTGRRTENHSDIVAVEDPERVGDRIDADEARSFVKDTGCRAILSDGAQASLINNLHHPKRLTCLDLKKMTSPGASKFSDLSRS